MGGPHPEAEALARRLERGAPQPELTAQIEACPCPPEVKAGLYFVNGDWERAHRVAQSLHSPAGAHWHALVHRHEPDYANSKYWLRRVGLSAVYPTLAAAAEEMGEARRVAPGGKWDPVAFTDCFADPAHASWTRKLDDLEVRTLLEHCLRG